MVLQALQKVFRKPGYVILGLTTSFVTFAFATWLPNVRLIATIISSPNASFSQKIGIPLSLLGSIGTNFTPLSASYTVAIAILFGVNLALVVYFLKRRITEVKQGEIATGIFGIASGVVGMGCAACGSLLLTSILSLFGATWVLSILPLGGGEFGILGVILLLISLYLTAKKIQNPAVCKINP